MGQVRGQLKHLLPLGHQGVLGNAIGRDLPEVLPTPRHIKPLVEAIREPKAMEINIGCQWKPNMVIDNGNQHWVANGNRTWLLTMATVIPVSATDSRLLWIRARCSMGDY